MSSSPEWKDKPVKYLRDKVVDQLKYNLVNNHLEIDEFEQMVTAALSTKSKSELLSLTADLPQKAPIETKPLERELAVYRDKKSINCILSESKTKGIWVPSKQLKVFTALGENEIDFRGAQLEPGLTYVSLGCWLGETRIIVPPGVNVVSNIKNYLGSVDNESQGKLNPDSPTIVFEGKVVLGEVRIAVKEQGEK
ncbi:MAG: DUF1707 domain-containing protein [Proteobacteria bacterium]|nr:DUF1707 domain-containing protein [Pseudomonadota bacterium]